ncbi:hypothetical protein BHM03_00008902 [Ensete ventricosum]|nr:hypothetical protein BHM03_00008902 [Ensete ventricosum]
MCWYARYSSVRTVPTADRYITTIWYSEPCDISIHINFNLIIGMMDLNEDLEMVQSPQKLKLTFLFSVLLFNLMENCKISFQEWTQQMKDMLEARKRGDFAFRDKDFKTAIECYSQFIDVGTMISPTVYARRSLCHLMCDQADAALRDAMQAQCLYPDWPTAFYMQAVALAKLNMQGDSLDMLQEATTLEEKRQKSGRGP